MKRIYLDYAATTPVDPAVAHAMQPYFSVEFGNPGSLHSFGQRASGAVFDARQTIARALGCHYTELVFTGSATEANNLALRGWRMADSRWQIVKGKPRIIISAIEHESILDTAEDLKKDGVEVVVIPVSREGIVDVKKLRAAINDRTILVSVMYANNETGTIQPITEIAKMISDFRSRHKPSANRYPLFHTDAVQVFQYVPCRVDELGVDLMTLSAHKIYGPKGIGALYVRNPKSQIPNLKEIPNSNIKNWKLEPGTWKFLSPLVTGGGQEEGLRSGTENVPYIVGFAKAVELTEKMREKETKRVATLRDYCWKQIKRSFPKAEMNGRWRMADSRWRIPNNLNFYLPKVNTEKVLVGLDLAGIAVSSGPACSSRSLEPSHVIQALGFNKERAKNSIRVTLGRQTTKVEIDYFLSNLKKLGK